MNDEVNTEVTNETPKMKKRVKNIAATATLTVLATENKKRGASAERFQNYLDAKPDTVQKALDAGLTMGDIAYDIIHGSITVEGAVVEEYEPVPRGSKPKDDSDVEDGEDGEDGSDDEGMF